MFSPESSNYFEEKLARVRYVKTLTAEEAPIRDSNAPKVSKTPQKISSAYRFVSHDLESYTRDRRARAGEGSIDILNI